MSSHGSRKQRIQAHQAFINHEELEVAASTICTGQGSGTL